MTRIFSSVRIALENSSNTLHTSALYLAFGTCFPVRRTTQAMPANKFHDKMYAVFCYYIRGLFSLCSLVLNADAEVRHARLRNPQLFMSALLSFNLRTRVTQNDEFSPYLLTLLVKCKLPSFSNMPCKSKHFLTGTVNAPITQPR